MGAIVLIAVLNLFVLSQASFPGTPRIQLNDGNQIPVLALGTGRGTAPKGESVNEVRNAVQWAIEAGYRHIDTAAIYEDEKQVGEGIQDAISSGHVKREDLFVTTKLWSDKHAKEQVLPALRNSLKELNLDYVDLYLIHFPIAADASGAPLNIDYLETWQGMEEAKTLGLAKSIGVSNFNSSQLERLIKKSKVKPAVNQVEVNPTLTQERLVSKCQDMGVVVMAYSPFGFVVSRKDQNAPPPRADDPYLTELANKYGKTTGQILLRYLIDRSLIPIPKSTNQKRIAENIAIFDFKLTNDEIKTINKFNKNKRVIRGEHYQNFPYYPFVNPE